MSLSYMATGATLLDSVEKVWWLLVTANRLYGSMAVLVDPVNAFRDNLSLSQVQTMAALREVLLKGPILFSEGA